MKNARTAVTIWLRAFSFCCDTNLFFMLYIVPHKTNIISSELLCAHIQRFYILLTLLVLDFLQQMPKWNEKGKKVNGKTRSSIRRRRSTHFSFIKCRCHFFDNCCYFVRVVHSFFSFSLSFAFNRDYAMSIWEDYA